MSKQRVYEGLVATGISPTGEQATVYAADDSDRFEVYLFPKYGSAQPPKFMDGPLSNVVGYLRELGFEVDSPFNAAYESAKVQEEYEFAEGNLEYNVLGPDGNSLGTVLSSTKSQAKAKASEKFGIPVEDLKVAVVSIDGEYVSGFPAYESSANYTPAESSRVRESVYDTFFAKSGKKQYRESKEEYKVTDKDRREVNSKFERAGLDGNGRFSSPSEALAVAQGVLSDHEFGTGMVSMWDLQRGVDMQHFSTELYKLERLEVGRDVRDSGMDEIIEVPTNSMLVLGITMIDNFNLSDNDPSFHINTASSDYPNARWEVVAYLS